MATCHPLVLLNRLPAIYPTPSLPFDSSGRNTVWNFTSSMLMTVGGADTPLHHRFFHSVTFEPQRLTEDSATAVPIDSLRHCDVGEFAEKLSDSSGRNMV